MWIVKGGRGKEGELGVQQTARRWVNGNAEGSSFKYEMLCFVVPTRWLCESFSIGVSGRESWLVGEVGEEEGSPYQS